MIYCSIYLFLSWFIGLVNVTMAVQKKKKKKRIKSRKADKAF
jgi:hypothetical protein